MALTADERAKVIKMLDDLDEAKKRTVLASLEAFGRWLKGALYSIYLKIKDALQSLWQSISDFFS
jgi:hypothetical protein